MESKMQGKNLPQQPDQALVSNFQAPLPSPQLLAAVKRCLRRIVSHLPLPEKELGRFVRFSMVGTLGATIDFSLLNIFYFGLGWTKFWANTGSFSLSGFSNFTWNRLWTFPESRDRPLRTQMPMFFAVYVVGYVINQSVFLGSDAFVYSHFFGPAVAVNLAKASASLVALLWNFTANRLWTYKGL